MKKLFFSVVMLAAFSASAGRFEAKSLISGSIVLTNTGTITATTVGVAYTNQLYQFVTSLTNNIFWWGTNTVLGYTNQWYTNTAIGTNFYYPTPLQGATPVWDANGDPQPMVLSVVLVPGTTNATQVNCLFAKSYNGVDNDLSTNTMFNLQCSITNTTVVAATNLTASTLAGVASINLISITTTTNLGGAAGFATNQLYLKSCTLSGVSP